MEGALAEKNQPSISSTGRASVNLSPNTSRPNISAITENVPRMYPQGGV